MREVNPPYSNATKNLLLFFYANNQKSIYNKLKH